MMFRLPGVLIVGLSSASSALYFAANKDILGSLFLVIALWVVLVMIND